MVARIVPVLPFDLVVFGATGDLAQRKLLPALYHRMVAGQMPKTASVIAAARTAHDDASYREFARDAIRMYVPAEQMNEAILEAFLACIQYIQLDALSEAGWSDLGQHLRDRGDRPRAFYLAVAPKFFEPICERLRTSGALTESARLVVEKPIGHSLSSARAINAHLSQIFDESRIYRIDHYLGKETVQNLMVLRFANALFEPLWNARHIDHVQITVAENVGVEGRGSYYDGSGALRDMVQNHLMQLLCLTAMEPPAHFEPDAVRDEKLKVLKALERFDPERLNLQVVRGQYRGYLEDSQVASSTTETFVALKAEIANWRWSGTPFYLRTGKKLRARVSEIAIVFKDAPHSIFPTHQGLRGNALIVRLQPDEAITLRMTIKDPGPGGMRLVEAPLDMTFADHLQVDGLRMPDAYERLVMDVVRGDQTLFMRGDEVEAAWHWLEPILERWSQNEEAPEIYDPGSAGPDEALMLLHQNGRRWREIR